MTALVILQSVVIALLAVLVVGLLRSHGDVLRRLHELGLDDLDGAAAPAGGADAVRAQDIARRLDPSVPPPPLGGRGAAVEAVAAADVAGVTPRGSALSVAVNGPGRLTLLAFLSSGCSTCAGFWQALRAGERLRLGGREVRTVVITGGPDQEQPAAVTSLAPPDVTVIMSSSAWADYAVPATPYFVLVDGEAGVVGEGSAAAWSQLAGLVERAAADRGFVVPAGGEGSGDGSGRFDVDSVGASRASSPGPAAATLGEGDGGPAREARADAALLAAGIGPGDERLYQSPFEEEPS